MSDSPTDGSAQVQGQHHVSEVARMLAQVRAEYEAAERGLSGLAAGRSKHEFIQKRTHEELAQLVGKVEAARLLAETIWSPDETGVATAKSTAQPLEEGNEPI